jgi:DNA polymerase III subunit gamma/tau
VIVALALYRKYRPATFAEVAGQDHVTEPLQVAIAAGRINHAYLFSGPRGCGKTSSARILARSLNCAQGPTAQPCGECESCVALAPEGPGSVDVIELDAASHGGVDDTRELRDRAFFTPAQSRYRIFIIDEAHMVTTQGFNALLKIVEEPPEHLIFVFATTEPDKVLTTIRSRTHHYPFRLMPPGVLRDLLERICSEEGVRVEPAVYPLVIRAGGGSARDTLSVLDQLLSGAADEGVTYERAVALLGVTDVALIDDMVDALAAGDGAAVYATVDRLVEAGHDPRRFASDLLDRLRDLVLVHAVPDAAQRGLIQAAGDELTKMQAQAEQLGAATLTRFGEIVHTGLIEMRGATAPRLLLELLCARMLLPTASDSEAALLQRLERVERRMTVAPPQPGAPDGNVDERPAQREAGRSEPDAPTRRAEPPAPEPATTAATEAPPEQAGARDGGFDAAAVRRVWTELLRAVAERNRPTQALLLNATVQELHNGTLVLSMPTAGLVKQFSQQHRIDVVQDAMRAVLGGEWQIRCVEGSAAARPAASRRNEPRQRPDEQRSGTSSTSPPAPDRRAPERPSPRSAAASPADDIPLPPEPDEEAPPFDEGPPQAASPTRNGGMELAGLSSAPPEPLRHDTEAAAVELLASELGARKIDDA